MRTLSVLLLAVACGGEAPEVVSPVGDSDSVPLADDAAGHCVYANPFSQADECKEYVGAGWTEAEAEADCSVPVPGGSPGEFVAAEACARDAYVGECVVDEGGALEVSTVFWGDDPGSCAGAELGCGFLGGEFLPSAVCDGTEEPAGVAAADAFQPFERVCVDPLAGSPGGQSEQGQVCTWQAVSGATEEGRRFSDYASCEPIFSQRPYYAFDVEVTTAPDDPRLDDAAWVDEFAWVTAQFEATSCSCCHGVEAPDGPSGWSLDDAPIWLDGVDDDGLAMLAGWVDSTAFGAFEAVDNNGFDRDVTGVPTTDVPRMAAFLSGELANRGLVRDDFADTPPFGGVLYDQLFYEPGPCAEGEGIGADGAISWSGGPARYLYVLEPDSMSPGVPPNLDVPQGTLWKLDVDSQSAPVASGVAYGSAPPGSVVMVPASGVAPTLTSGDSYYLVALLDIYQPATRCVFVAP